MGRRGAGRDARPYGEGRQKEATMDRERVYGVDFSGARDAGRRIWLAEGRVGGGRLRVEGCYPAEELPGSGRDREAALGALRRLIATEPGAAFGLDFPFGLPLPLLVEEVGSWEAFVRSFPADYPTADAFRQSCRARHPDGELKRRTDVETRTPFAAYNLRLFRQTYYGIREVLYPLVRDGAACVLPMQARRADRAWVLEICPASTLKREGLPAQGYKAKTEEGRRTREAILAGLEGQGQVEVGSAGLRARIIEEEGGDALDSVIAAWATYRAIGAPEIDPVAGLRAYALEGYVYV
jgi:hypothetical protein